VKKMGLLKKTDSKSNENETNQDINFLKQNIKPDNNDTKSSNERGNIPKLSDILKKEDPTQAKSTNEKSIFNKTPSTSSIPQKNNSNPGEGKSTSSPEKTQTPASPAPHSSLHKTSEIADNSINDLKSQVENQNKLIEQQKKKIEILEMAIKKIETIESAVKSIESNNVKQLVTKNEELLKKLTTKIEGIEKDQTREGEDSQSDEERALIKAGKYLEKQMQNVNATYEKLDGKMVNMRKFMTELDDKEHRFIELEDQLNKLQRRTESIIEIELISKSNEAIKNLDENKENILNESETLLKNIEERVQWFKNDIEAMKQNSIDSIDKNISRMKDTEIEVRKTIDEKLQYDNENMKRVDEVILIMNETVQKILGGETMIPEAPAIHQ
jgi:hypothetical protein